MATAQEISPTIGVEAACASLGIARASLYRHQKPSSPRRPRPTPARSLSVEERADVLYTLNAEPFIDDAPAQVHASLLDAGVYLCSARTMYRILAANRQVRERRDVRRHPSYQKPELMATAPNQVWSWDITKLKGPAKGTYFHLYVILDIFSRYAVGWMVAANENARLAQRLIDETCAKQNIVSGQLTIHSDRGAPMTAKSTAQLFADLVITGSYSRPRVSNDNPFSESQFRTLKYRPAFPRRFGSLHHAVAVSQELFAWYNNQHHHSALGFLTPEDVHYGRARDLLAQRQRVLDAAYAAHPDRFVRSAPRPRPVPDAVWINPPKEVPDIINIH